jgi:hypothetical protein
MNQPQLPQQAAQVWENQNPPPIQIGKTLFCPLCNAEIAGPFSATLANNTIVRKWACSNSPSCHYVWRIEGGQFRSAFDANPVTFG